VEAGVFSEPIDGQGLLFLIRPSFSLPEGVVFAIKVGDSLNSEVL